MHVEKRHLANLDMVYAVALTTINGREYCLAGSEKENGSVLLIDTEEGRVITLWDGPGGVMSLVPVEHEEGTFLSIDEFYPVFRSERASINRTKLTITDGGVRVEKTVLCRLPFVHRIALVSGMDGLYLAAASLCSAKKYADDWSSPGGIYIGKYDAGSEVELKPVYMGLSKNHGMFVESRDGRDVLWVGAHEGVVCCFAERASWHAKPVMDIETSDIWIYDIDRDGEAEMATIQGFHGNEVNLYKKMGGSYEKIACFPVRFGHVVWIGDILGRSALITASRAGDMALDLYMLSCSSNGLIAEKITLDTGVGTTQIAVSSDGKQARIYAANHETGTVDMYQISG